MWRQDLQNGIRDIVDQQFRIQYFYVSENLFTYIRKSNLDFINKDCSENSVSSKQCKF